MSGRKCLDNLFGKGLNTGNALMEITFLSRNFESHRMYCSVIDCIFLHF
jgi:hypothetical protein